MTRARTATTATNPETYTNQQLRCDSALPPDYHADRHRFLTRRAYVNPR